MVFDVTVPVTLTSSVAHPLHSELFYTLLFHSPQQAIVLVSHLQLRDRLQLIRTEETEISFYQDVPQNVAVDISGL